MNARRSRRTRGAGLVCVLVSCGALTGCGGDQGGDGAGGSGGNGVGGLIGTLIGGAATAGVSYETDTRSGVTAEDGTFRYEEGETVRFFVGDTVLGETSAKDEISPFDLVPEAQPLTGNDILAALNNRCSPLGSVINVAAFLQTLDRDGDLNNGIEIPNEVAALFEGVSVDFMQSLFLFRRDLDLRAVLSQANAEVLFDSHRQVRPAAFAAQDLYSSLGLDSGLFAVTRVETDEGADNTIDSIRESRYDERAQLVFSSRDTDANGEPDSTSSFEYDENGHQVRSESDDDGNGSPDSITQSQFNEDGDRIRVERDRDGDGDADSVSTTTYDDIGRRLRDETDQNNSGSPNRIVIYWYDDDARQDGSREDEDGDGIIDRSTTNFFDESGNRIRREVDLGDDGTVNSRDIFEYDARGNVTRTERDRDGDGEIDDISVSEYNEMCRVTYREEQDGNGMIERTTTTVYDDAGRELSRTTDSDGNGMPDRIDTSEYDDSGNLLSRADDDNADGTPEFIELFEYIDGALSRVVTDQDNDGTPDRIQLYTSEPTDGWARALDD